ncbi:hypothetical protein AWC38_SpisGene24237 [Stylophora pistillata]|uniref:Integrase core domain-containing protein n=1 Tax=Stylophora pistillata TaxID=50429 RepID=A0A2B4R4Z5_STYPI|nr:hypothetical protein AWC38_SpisGene24237 [Stylophora pistillata]
MPLPVYSPCMNVNSVLQDDQLELISSYFKQGYSNLKILEFLKLHGITISISTLKRRLRTLGLSRRPMNIPLDELKRIIERELGGSGCFVGYRRIWARLRKKGYLVKRITVMKLLRELDPEGVESRKKKRLLRRIYHAKGPNFIWHIDGYDKLKPYRFCVYGAIDGFSRRLNWLELGMVLVGGLIFFKDLRDLGLFIDSDPVHVDCIRFCFMPILRNELYQVAELWNQHRISSSKFANGSGPRRRPDWMFFLPHLYSTDDYKTDVDEDDVQEFYDHSTMCPPDYSDDFKEFALTVMNEYHLPEPHDVSSALDLYIELLKEVETLT